jgi:hypothetical protein
MSGIFPKPSKYQETADLTGDISITVERGYYDLVNMILYKTSVLQGFITSWFDTEKDADLKFFRYPPSGLFILGFFAILTTGYKRKQKQVRLAKHISGANWRYDGLYKFCYKQRQKMSSEPSPKGDFKWIYLEY